MVDDAMTLVEVSPNIQELELGGRKRSHDEYSDDLVKMDVDAESEPPPNKEAAHGPREASVLESSAGPPTPMKTSPDTRTADDRPTTSPEKTSTVTLAVKRKRLTGAEKEARDKEAAEQKKVRDQNMAEKAAIRAAEKAKQEEAKAARLKERDEKRKKKEEEQQRAQEEKDRKARSQKTLGSFFKIPSTPKKADGDAGITKDSPSKSHSAATRTPKPPSSAYTTMFRPFFIKEHTRLARLTPAMDEATRDRKCHALDRGITSQTHAALDFRPQDLFGPCCTLRPRGRLHRPVKHIMESAYRETQSLGAAGAAADGGRIHDEVRQQLQRVPVKVISFSQDVRPPYYGTLTLTVFGLGKGRLGKAARRSMARRLPLDYDYDSEAEWQEEEGEDVDVDEDEEEPDDDDDMDGFLDDSEDAGVSRRIFGNTMEPESTGVCFESEGVNPVMREYKMEFILDNLHTQIDPFSTKYWEPEPAASKTRQAGGQGDQRLLVPPAATHGSGPTRLVKAELMKEFKQAILDNRVLSKAGIIDIIFHQFRNSVSRAEVKNTLEAVAEKRGAGRIKEWGLKPGHE